MRCFASFFRCSTFAWAGSFPAEWTKRSGVSVIRTFLPRSPAVRDSRAGSQVVLKLILRRLCRLRGPKASHEADNSIDIIRQQRKHQPTSAWYPFSPRFEPRFSKHLAKSRNLLQMSLPSLHFSAQLWRPSTVLSNKDCCILGAPWPGNQCMMGG